MEWTDALREYAKIKGTKYHIPKKGTKEYAEVKTLQATGKIGGGKIRIVEPTEVERLERAKKRKTITIHASAEHMKKHPEILKSGKIKKFVLTKKKAPAEPARHPSGRKVRSDKGKKRMTARMIAEESVKQGLVSRAVAFGRKERSDKGKKRGKRMPKSMPVEEKKEEMDEMFYYQ